MPKTPPVTAAAPEHVYGALVTLLQALTRLANLAGDAVEREVYPLKETRT